MTSTDAIGAAHREGPGGPSALLLICEHASNAFPDPFGALGLSADARRSHAAWDPGALDLSRALSAHLDAPLIRGGVSRLVYDCNRPPDAPDAMPVRSEIWEVPGNADLTETERAARIEAIYEPFHAAVTREIDAAATAAIVTVHSFTPVYRGARRSAEIGILHDADSRLADAMLARSRAAPWRVERNVPYGPGDGVTHTLRRHGLARGLPNAMIEVRNDLLAAPEGVRRIAGWLAPVIADALAHCGVTEAEAG